MHVFSKPVRETKDGVENYMSCSNSNCNIIKHFVFMQCCAHCLNIYCTMFCCENDGDHASKNETQVIDVVFRRSKSERRIQHRVE